MKVMRLSIAAIALLGSASLLVPAQAQERAAEKKEQPKRVAAVKAIPVVPGQTASGRAAAGPASGKTAAEKPKSVKVEPDNPMFKAPVMLMSGDSAMGGSRIYPSPVMHDVDGDGQPEMIIGDLRGAVTMTKRDAASSSPNWGATNPVKNAEGTDLKFKNW